MTKFGDFLYALRKESGMTQSELADRLDLTNKAISKWETGEAFPETAQLVPLSNIFGVTVDELLRGERNASAQKSDAVPYSQMQGAFGETANGGGSTVAQPRKEEEDEEENPVVAVVCACVMLVAVIAYLLLGVFADVWHKAWVILPAGALVCAVAGTLGNKKEHRLRDTLCVLLVLGPVVAYCSIGVALDVWHPTWVMIPIGAMLCGIVGALFNLLGKKKE